MTILGLFTAVVLGLFTLEMWSTKVALSPTYGLDLGNSITDALP